VCIRLPFPFRKSAFRTHTSDFAEKSSAYVLPPEQREKEQLERAEQEAHAKGRLCPCVSIATEKNPEGNPVGQKSRVRQKRCVSIWFVPPMQPVSLPDTLALARLKSP
jgi:hypothetical protein